MTRPPAGLVGVPARDGAADQVGDVLGVGTDDIARRRLDPALGLGAQVRIIAQRRSDVGNTRFQALAQFGVGVRTRLYQPGLDVGPQRAGPGPYGRVVEQFQLERVDLGRGGRVVLQCGDVGAQAYVQRVAQVVLIIDRDVVEELVAPR